MRQVRQGASWSGAERNRLFLHAGLDAASLPRYFDASAISGVDFADDARSVGITDWDLDGDLDFWVRNRSSPRLRLMLNQHIDEDMEQDHRGQGHLTLKLHSRSGNRDAIGARVEIYLKNQPQPLVRTVRAGGAFLSQSSKWLHSGLGESPEIEEMSVRWPGGERESFPAIEPNHRYLLIQGSGEAERLPTRKTPAVLNSAQANPPLFAAASGRAILPRKIPVPALPQFDLAHSPERRALWIVLWSIACPHCQSFMKSLTRDHATLTKSGLDVVALSVDDGKDAVRAFLQSIQAPYAWEMAAPDTLTFIDSLQAGLFDLPAAPAVPLHLLFDASTPRNLVALFRGDVESDDLSGFLTLTGATDQQLRDFAAPFPGQWYTVPKAQEGLLEFLGEKLRTRDPRAAAFYYERAGSPGKAARLFHDLAMATSDQVSPDQVERDLRRAIALDDRFAQAYNNLGALLANQRKWGEARTCFERALRLDPQNEKARLNLEILRFLR